uniref:(northern house mosquito) hypothetical protein n=1 Tax=Culex pipiens TaxID=7175 RepID=A0A8D7ZXA1_CULPI
MDLDLYFDSPRLHEPDHERDVQLQALPVLAGQTRPLPEPLLPGSHPEPVRVLRVSAGPPGRAAGLYAGREPLIPQRQREAETAYQQLISSAIFVQSHFELCLLSHPHRNTHRMPEVARETLTKRKKERKNTFPMKFFQISTLSNEQIFHWI